MNKNNEIKEWIYQFKSRRECSICGYNLCMSALEFHHIDEEKKYKNIPSINTWGNLYHELDKCTLICCLCHREIHAGIRYKLIPVFLSPQDKQELYNYMTEEKQKIIKPLKIVKHRGKCIKINKNKKYTNKHITSIINKVQAKWK